MTQDTSYRRFAHKGANFRIRCDRFEAVTAEIVRLRGVLEAYIGRHAEFATALAPIELKDGAPDIARRMADAARAVGVGPMAAVAGTVAQLAAQAGLAAGADEAVVENGGDIYLAARRTVVIGLYAGSGPLAETLALAVPPQRMPTAICSSSGTMGHSLSLGRCDLATVVARSASLADAAATQAANLVRTQADIDPALNRIGSVDGVDGVLIVLGERVGLIGQVPPLVRHRDAELGRKVTRDPRSGG